MTAKGNPIPDYSSWDVIVIGGGPAGMAAALTAKKHDRSVLIIERGRELGGILGQCIHSGFGLHEFKEELTGPEYAQRFIDAVFHRDIAVLVDTMVIDLTGERQLTAVQSGRILHLTAGAVILAMGCRERTAGAISLCGTRPGGIFTAGMAQKLVNESGYLVGKKIVIYGSGDIGLIMARRMTLEGAHVEAVVEILPVSTGLPRNIAQCLDDFGIPLKLSTAIARIHGEDRVTAVTLVRVDANRQPIPGTEAMIVCDTLLLSVGLIPESELAVAAGIGLHPLTGGPSVDAHLMTSVPGIFASGNALHVHDIVDFVSDEGRRAGEEAARWISGQPVGRLLPIEAGPGIRYVLPGSMDLAAKRPLDCSMRPTEVREDAAIRWSQDGRVIRRQTFRRLHPAEMIRLELDPAKLDPAGGPVCFEVEVSHE